MPGIRTISFCTVVAVLSCESPVIHTPEETTQHVHLLYSYLYASR